jgi:hypothetical protein
VDNVHPVSTGIIPMPGRLPVSRLVRSLPGRGIHVETPLDQVDTDTMVTATGTIATVRYLDNKVFGRTMIVLTSEDGNSAHVLFDADATYYAEPVLRKGTRIELHGLVTRHIPGQPAGLEGLGVRAVSA